MGNGAIKPPSELSTEQKQSILGGNENCSLEGVAAFILSGRAKNIVCIVGAGASVSAGIPDFRTPGTGLYDNLAKYNLPEGKPESVFDLEYFKTDPLPFYALAKELYPGEFKPTPCHQFLLLLHAKKLLRRVYTQNIDGLESIVGLPESQCVQCHGGTCG